VVQVRRDLGDLIRCPISVDLGNSDTVCTLTVPVLSLDKGRGQRKPFCQTAPTPGAKLFM